MQPSRARGQRGHFPRLADMSVPPAERKRKRKGKGSGRKGVIGQMQHANTPEANKARRAFYKASRRRGKRTAMTAQKGTMMTDTGYVQAPGLTAAEVDVMRAAAARFTARPDAGVTVGGITALAQPGQVPALSGGCGDYWKRARSGRHIMGCPG